ncbi:MAG: hypothetical protein M1476_05485 [Candidatus Thermoplasmatota archaeon]|nr:hypothetical protein [Candidatus Thermoplasmatota archaeon]
MYRHTRRLIVSAVMTSVSALSTVWLALSLSSFMRLGGNRLITADSSSVYPAVTSSPPAFYYVLMAVMTVVLIVSVLYFGMSVYWFFIRKKSISN